MNRDQFSTPKAVGALLMVLLVAVFVVSPTPLNAWEAGPVVIGPGGGDGSIPGPEGDPIDSNDYSGGDPLGGGDGGDHSDIGTTDSAVLDPASEPGIHLFTGWMIRPYFGPARVAPAPTFWFFKLVATGRE